MAEIIALVIGLIAAAAGIFIALRAAGFFVYMGGKKSRPDAVDKETLTHRLLALNDKSKPYHIIRGEDTDLVAEWKIVDATWYGIFSKNRLTEAYRALLQLDEARHSVRCYEELGKVNWSAGTEGLKPSVHYERTFFGGRVLYRKEWGKGYGIQQLNPPQAGKVYDYKFDVDEIRQPIMAVVQESGWEWVPVTGRKNATYRRHDPASPAATSRAVFCGRCGAKVRSDAIFCPRCGSKVG